MHLRNLQGADHVYYYDNNLELKSQTDSYATVM